MCMKCGCSTPNDKKLGAVDYGNNGGSAKSGVIVGASDTHPGAYEGNGGY